MASILSRSQCGMGNGGTALISESFKSPDYGLYIHQLLQANNKENIEILALCEENRRMSGEIFSPKAANAENLFVS